MACAARAAFAVLHFWAYSLGFYGIAISKELLSRLCVGLAALAFVGFMGFFFLKEYIPFIRDNRDLRTYLVPSYPIWQLYKSFEGFKHYEFVHIGQDAHLNAQDSAKALFVLVVGETARSANMSLNGYKQNDTNFYTKELSPVSFSDSYGKNSENLLDVLARVGVEIFWLDNNSGGCKGVCNRLKQENVIQLWADGDGYDGAIFKMAKEKIKELSKLASDNKGEFLLVLHLQGSHGPTYYKRYPSEFARFKPTCNTSNLSTCSHLQIVNTYDNTLLYASDHGESLGEGGVYLHSLPYAIAPLYQSKVAAMFYSPDKALMAKVQGLKDEKLSHDFIFSSVLGFFKVQTKVYDKSLDIFAK